MKMDMPPLSTPTPVRKIDTTVSDDGESGYTGTGITIFENESYETNIGKVNLVNMIRQI